MGRSGMKTIGVFFRNTTCFCGKHYRANPRTADKLMKVHMKVVHGIDKPDDVINVTRHTDNASNKNNPQTIKK